MNATARPTSNVVRFVFQIVLLAAMIWGVMNYRLIGDEIAVRTFHPDEFIVGYEARLDLTAKGKRMLYGSSPRVDDKATFNSDCNTRPHELELGCYYRGKIFILQIREQSLASEMDVVTTHELLHAQWSRMSRGDREKIGAELERVYALVADDDLRERMAGYAKSEPGEETNELHSILATEFASLSPMLEGHYRQILADRQVIVDKHIQYKAEFSNRRQGLESELADIRALKGRLATLNKQLEGYRVQGQIGQYNALIPRQNDLVDDINSRISKYKAGVEEYNALSRSIDSQQIDENSVVPE